MKKMERLMAEKNNETIKTAEYGKSHRKKTYLKSSKIFSTSFADRISTCFLIKIFQSKNQRTKTAFHL